MANSDWDRHARLFDLCRHVALMVARTLTFGRMARVPCVTFIPANTQIRVTVKAFAINANGSTHNIDVDGNLPPWSMASHVPCKSRDRWMVRRLWFLEFAGRVFAN